MKNVKPVKTDIGQAIIAAVEAHKDFEMPIWLKRIYDELKKQDASK